MTCDEEIQLRTKKEHEDLVEQAKSNIIPFLVNDKTRMNGRSQIVARANVLKHFGEKFGREGIGHWMEVYYQSAQSEMTLEY
ncbi:hypothetical protein H9L39_09914 [Fusarium oxysporum f. sp. albedinis]|nr:hypothetical protein H9L39_09914 [Fusarium oxysporum f. sp. albedinis]